MKETTVFFLNWRSAEQLVLLFWRKWNLPQHNGAKILQKYWVWKIKFDELDFQPAKINSKIDFLQATQAVIHSIHYEID